LIRELEAVHKNQVRRSYRCFRSAGPVA